MTLYGNFRQVQFTDVPANDWTQANKHVWDNADNFLADWKDTLYYSQSHTSTADWMTDSEIKLIFNLLYAEYGNSVVASSDINRFKHKVFTLIWEYGPTWAKRVDVQHKLRQLTEEQIITGSTAQYDSMLNPQTAPAADIGNYLNSRNITQYTKSKLEGYAILSELLKADVSNDFIRKFRTLFLVVVAPEKPLWYTTEITSEDQTNG